MTSVFHLYYFIDSRASMVVHSVSMHLAFPFPLPFSSSQFQPREGYFEKWPSKEQILSHCCCWLIQLFDHVANGHDLHKWNLQLWMINCQKTLVELFSCEGSSLVFVSPTELCGSCWDKSARKTPPKKDAALTDHNFTEVYLNSDKFPENEPNLLEQTVT